MPAVDKKRDVIVPRLAITDDRELRDEARRGVIAVPQPLFDPLHAGSRALDRPLRGGCAPRPGGRAAEWSITVYLDGFSSPGAE